MWLINIRSDYMLAGEVVAGWKLTWEGGEDVEQVDGFIGRHCEYQRNVYLVYTNNVKRRCSSYHLNLGLE